MAAFSDIKFTTIEGRPCWVDGRRAIFHRWSDSARPVKGTAEDPAWEGSYQKWSVHAIVEYEDGTVERHWPNQIHLADSAQQFAAFDWDTMEARRDGRPWGAEEITDETDRDKLMAKAQEYLEEIGAELPTVEIEINRWCDSCAHENPILWAEYCGGNDYDCPNCKAPGCICKTCTDSDKWEPKEGQA